jgi:prepilin-type N-terminal cleavage/methylation domain-containing protein
MILAPRRSPNSARRQGRARGFTLIELMITLTALAIVMTILMAVIYAAVRSRTGTANRMESVQAARAAVDMMARDIRSAGYGADLTYPVTPQPSIAYVDSQEIILSCNVDPAIKAYDPAGTPKPRPLQATSWTPPGKYRTGAELIRWTLDLNNDGAVNAADVASAGGADAQSTRNPNDYVLVRQVYGDSVANVAGGEGGTTENIALVQHPGGANPPMFQVYMRGSSTPWNWQNGPIPVAQLRSIQRIDVQVTAASSKPDSRGQYATTTLKAQVNSTRNTPDFGQPQYNVDGYVYNDLNNSRSPDAGEPGIPGVSVRLGQDYTGITDVSGHFLIRAPAGTYTLRHYPNAGYGNNTQPDSFSVTLPPGTTRSFADTARAGGWVTVSTFNDLDGDGIKGVSEPWLSALPVTVTPGSQIEYTDVNGSAQLFAGVGSYTINATVPDSMFCTTSNDPFTGTMTNGGSASVLMGFSNLPTGTIKGKVYVDANRDGIMNGGDVGKAGVWVGVTNNGGYNILRWQYTTSTGDYSLDVPRNQPPGTTPYSVYIVVPAGFFPTTSTAINGVFVSQSQVIPNQNFGLNSFQPIQLSAQRVLSLASGDLIEKDWPGNNTNKRGGDADLVLGADAAGTDQVSVWFNQYDSTPLFNATRDYNRTAANAVMCLALDTLDTGAGLFQKERADVVTGTKYAAAGNFFVWLNQNTSSNEGFLMTTPSRAYKTSDNGDVQALLTGDFAGTTATRDLPDILVGTKSPTAGAGTVELWMNNNAATPDWTQTERYPDVSYTMGEVTGMALGDLDGDGLADLVVACHTTAGAYTGEVLIFRNKGRTASPRFQYQGKISMLSHSPTCVGLSDVNGDGMKDILVGTVSGVAQGAVRYYQNLGSFTFSMIRTVSAPGPVQCMAIADFGGGLRNDIAIGWRTDTGSYSGGVLIYFTDLGTLPLSGIDPSAGLITNWCAALTANNFNYGLYPTWSGAQLMDLAAGIKSSANAGALWVLVR